MLSRRCLMSLLIVLAFLPIGFGPLYEPDEGRYAEVGRAMLLTGDWLVPRFCGKEHLTKPPFAYWTVAAGTALFGATSLGARFFVGLANLLTLLALFRIASRLGGPRAAQRAVLIFATSIYGFGASHYLSADVFIVLWQALAALCGLEALRAPDSSGRRRWVIGFWVALGLGFLTKGPPGILVALAVLATASRSRTARLRDFLASAGLPAFIVLSVSWFGWLCLREPKLWRYFLVEEVWQRVATARHHREHSRWLYAAILALGPLPFLTSQYDAGRRLVRWWRRGRRRLDDGRFLLVVWVVGSLAIFLLSRSRMFLYLGPPFAALSVLLALASRFRGRRCWARATWVAFGVWCLVIVGLQQGIREFRLGGEARRAALAIREGATGEDYRVVTAAGRQLGSVGYFSGSPRPLARLSRSALRTSVDDALAPFDAGSIETFLVIQPEDLTLVGQPDVIHRGERLAVLRLRVSPRTR